MSKITQYVRHLAVVAIATLAAQCAWATGGVISINFNAGQGNGTADSGMVHVPAEAWMNVTGTANTRAGNSMNYYNGSEVVAGPSTMSIVWDASSNWSYSDGITDDVLKGYLDDGKNTAITITGLPFKKYNVYLICATDTENAKFRHWTVNGVDYIGSESGSTVGTGTWGNTRNPTCALGTNVIKVADQTGALTIVGAGKSGSNRGTIAAIQVEEVEVPAAPEANFVFDGASKSITRPEGETGWWNGWGGEGLNADTSALSPNGFVGAVAEGRHPWTGSTVPSEFTLSLYTDPSLVSGDTKKLFWTIGDGLTSNIITLARDGDNLVFSAVGGSVSTPVPGAGYHLVTVTFSTSAISIAIDGQTPVKAEGTYNAVTTGFQIGSAYRGLPSGFAKPIGLPIAKLMGFSKVLTDAEIAALAVDYPAETIITGARTFTGANLYIGSMKHMSGRLEVNRGKLNIPAGHTYSVPALRFGNDGGNGSGVAFGLELDGTLIISGGQTTDGNGQNGVRADVVNNRGGILGGEWTGQGVYNIRGTLDARNSFVQLVHDASAQTWNVANGGVFQVKAFEARPSQGKVESTHIINIANGGQVISTQGFTRGKLMANVEAGGVLEIASTATVNMEGNDLSGITGQGQLKLTGSGYCVIPNGEGKCPAETIEIVNNLANGIVVPAVAEVTIGSLSGTGTFRYDWGSNSRTLVVKQSKDTTWSGGIFSSTGHGSNSRALNIVVKSENDSVLTVSGTVNGPASSTLTAGEGGTIKITGSCTGTGVVLDGGKLQSTGFNSAHGTMVKSLKLLKDGTYEWVEGGSTQIGIGANGVESTLDLNNHKITFTGKGTEQYDRVYLDKTTIPNAGTIEVTKGRLFIHCTVPTFPEGTKLIIGQNATIEVAGEIADKTMTVTELEYNGTVAAPANEAPTMVVTSKFSGTGSIQKLTLGDGAEVSGSAAVTVSATAQGTVKLTDGATLTVPSAFADGVVTTDVAGKKVVYADGTYSLAEMTALEKLVAAIDAAAEGDTVTATGDIALEAGQIIEKAVVIDLNGNTLTVSNPETAQFIAFGAKITNGTIAKSGAGYIGFTADTDATIVLSEGGVYSTSFTLTVNVADGLDKEVKTLDGGVQKYYYLADPVTEVTFTLTGIQEHVVVTVTADGEPLDITADNQFTAPVNTSVVVTSSPAEGYEGTPASLTAFTVVGGMTQTTIAAPQITVTRIVPTATVTELSKEVATAAGLDAAYAFTAGEAVEGFDDYSATFVVTFDKAIKAGSFELKGAYEADFSTGHASYDWTPMQPAEDINVGDSWVLLPLGTVTYGDVLKIGTFNCGVANKSADNDGTTMTVTLILTNGEETLPIAEKSYKLTYTATRPSEVEGGSTDQKSAYDKWAKEAGSLSGLTNAQIIDRFIFNVDADTPDEDLEDALDEVIEKTDCFAKLMAEIAKGSDPTAYTFTLEVYPNATFKFVEVPETEIKTSAKLFRLTATFVPANDK